MSLIYLNLQQLISFFLAFFAFCVLLKVPNQTNASKIALTKSLQIACTCFPALGARYMLRVLIGRLCCLCVVIGQSNSYGFGFTTLNFNFSIENRFYTLSYSRYHVLHQLVCGFFSVHSQHRIGQTPLLLLGHHD